MIAYKILDPTATASEEKKQMTGKIEGLLDEIYKDETIPASDYTQFMQSYTQDFETKLKENPNYKFEYQKKEAEKKEEHP